MNSLHYFSLVQRKVTKENIGCKLFAINSALRKADLSIHMWEMNLLSRFHRESFGQHFPNLLREIIHH
jgi:hypothetical protein